MKHLLSLVAVLAATVALLLALLLALPGTARADSVDSTTAAPNPSGFATCSGHNSDNSTATWTVGGRIHFTSEYQNPPAQGVADGFHNVHPGAPSPFDPMGGSICEYQGTTSSDVKTNGCDPIDGDMNLYFTPYTGGGSPEYVGGYAITSPSASTTYVTSSQFTFKDILDAKNVQYKVTSEQGMGTLGTVATPYL